MSQELWRRIWKWRTSRESAELENGYVETMSQQKESYDKQLNKLQELLKNESIDELTYERMKTALDNSLVQRRGEANARRVRQREYRK
jgi:hypothetical protein